jgi:hypothetical protein
VPAAVLQNYMIAREDVQQRMVFTRDLMRKYADPRTGAHTADPIALPAFGVRSSNLNGSGGFGDALSALRQLAPSTLVSTKDVVVSVPPVPESGDNLGNPLGVVALIATIGATIAVTGFVAIYIIDAVNEHEVKLAEQAVELEKQTNFARVWDTAQALVAKCIGQNPTPDVIAKCWENVAERFPAIVAAIPEHKFSSGQGMGFFGKLGLAAAAVGTVFVGIWAYRRWGKRNAPSGGGGDFDVVEPTRRRSRSRSQTARSGWMNGAEVLPMARPEAPERGYGAPAPRTRKRARARK